MGIIDKITGIFTGMLAGYLIGMVIGFTLFDPNLDVWALLSFGCALLGIGVGLLAIVRRNRSGILAAIIGFYLAWLLQFLIFADAQENGLDLLQNGIGGFLIVISGTILGAWLGWRYRSEILGYTLFAVVLGGFFGGLILGMLAGLGDGSSMLVWSIFVILSSFVAGFVVWKMQTRSR